MNKILAVVAFAMQVVSCVSTDGNYAYQLNIRVTSLEQRTLIRWAALRPESSSRVRIAIFPPPDETVNFLHAIGYEGHMPGNIMGSFVLDIDGKGRVTHIEGAIQERLGLRPVMFPEPGFKAIASSNRTLTIKILQRLYAMGLL